MKTKNILIIAWTILLTSGCAPRQIASISNPELSETAKRIMNKRWLEADVLVIQNPDTVEHNITFQFPKYERDDVLVLQDNGSYQYDEGSSKFQEDHKQVFVEGSWTITADEKHLCLTATGSTNTYDIVEITDSTLVLMLAINQGEKTYAYKLSFKSTE